MYNNESTHVTAMSMKMHVIVKLNDGNLEGELNCKHFEEPFKFSSFMSMIDMMETTFDAKGFPEKQVLPRTFGPSKPRVRKHEMDLQALLKEYTLKHESASAGEDSTLPAGAEQQKAADKTCTFDILVRFRHNAEWQGSIHWIEKDVTKQFSSILELIKLMDNALAE